jgi:hypothetical protein
MLYQRLAKVFLICSKTFARNRGGRARTANTAQIRAKGA